MAGEVMERWGGWGGRGGVILSFGQVQPDTVHVLGYSIQSCVQIGHCCWCRQHRELFSSGLW